jgi:hypothetical protein
MNDQENKFTFYEKERRLKETMKRKLKQSLDSNEIEQSIKEDIRKKSNLNYNE